MQMNTYKAGGIIFKIYDKEFVGKKANVEKREIIIEVPTENSMAQGTELYKLETLFEETSALDNFAEGQWVDFVFRVTGRSWYPKDEPTKLVVFTGLRLIDMRKAPSPFDEGKDIKNKPEDLSNTIVSDLADKVKDWGNEPKQTDIFEQQKGDEFNDLPF